MKSILALKKIVVTASVVAMVCMSLESSLLSGAAHAAIPSTPNTNLAQGASITPVKKPDFVITKSRKLAFSFQNVNVRSLLQLIGKESGLNFVISEAVTGKLTLNIQDVTWQEALSIILKTQGLASRRIGNVMYISTIEEITSTETKRLQSEEALSNLAPITSTIISLRYSNAADLAKLLKGDQGNLMTPRGEVAVDSRTNTLIVRDVATNIKQIRQAIKRLDKPAKQVLIEARIVTIDTTYEQQIGVRFGMSDTRHLSGTLAGANQLTQGTDVSEITPLAQRLNFNVPATNLFNNLTPGSFGLALARVGKVLLDLELSALEGESHAQVISRPRVVTSNQQKATIQTGEEIPYQESTSSGATSVTFKKAVLSLEITPQITPNNKIILKIKATQNTRGTPTTVSANVQIPSINTQEVESNILLNNNETIAIGGVYKVTKNNILDRIPFFGSLPVVGHLFRHTGEKSIKNELLIFITPKIITQQLKKAKPELATSKSGIRFDLHKELKK